MTKGEYKNRRTGCCWGGVITFWLASGAAQYSFSSIDVNWLAVVGFSTASVALMIYGCYCWAKYKGRNGWLSLLGLLGLIGFLILSRLKDRWVEVS